MKLPPNIDAQIRQRFDNLITEASKIREDILLDARRSHEKNRDSGIVFIGEFHSQESPFFSLTTRAISLIQMVLGKTDRCTELADRINKMKSGSETTAILIGIMSGLKDDYENGMLEDLSAMIEVNISADYMGQAEQLLGEGTPGQFDHVPAAVLTGAILEDALRRLCQRQTPPIDVQKPDGTPIKIDTLIADLQKANVFNKMKADQLRSWTKIRNFAAHGEFSQFTRQDVEAMITGVKNFLADFL